MTVRARSLAGFGMAVLAVAALSSCASSSPGSTSTPTPTSSSSAEIEFEAAWLDGGRMIAIVTDGSSTCVPTAGDTSYKDGVLEVELVDPAEASACTMDMVPRATLVTLPEGVDPSQDLEIRLTGGATGDTDLDGVEGLTGGGETDYLPTAGWAGDGQFVILTWGSSGCPPMIENVEPTSASDVTVTFATPPTDQACTADMAPRATVAQVDTTTLGDEVFAILTGAEFDNIRVAIVGED